MASALENQLAIGGEMDADIRAVEFFLYDQRLVGDERLGFGLAEMLVVVRTLRAKNMRRSGVLDEFVV